VDRGRHIIIVFAPAGDIPALRDIYQVDAQITLER
jgi:hypothetical protein